MVKVVGVSILKKVILFITILAIFTTGNNLVDAEPPEPNEIKPYAKDWYATSEDIILDIIFPSIDKRVMQEYPGKDGATLGWESQRFVGIVYNNNHSYDISIKIGVPDNANGPSEYTNDLVKVRVSPSCHSPKIDCRHGFDVEVLEYKHLEQ